MNKIAIFGHFSVFDKKIKPHRGELSISFYNIALLLPSSLPLAFPSLSLPSPLFPSRPLCSLSPLPFRYSLPLPLPSLSGTVTSKSELVTSAQEQRLPKAGVNSDLRS